MIGLLAQAFKKVGEGFSVLIDAEKRSVSVFCCLRAWQHEKNALHAGEHMISVEQLH